MMHSSIDDVIALYRAAGKPQLESGYFKGSVIDTYFETIKSLNTGEHRFGRFSELLVDSKEILPGEDLPKSWEAASFTWILALDSKNKFYRDIEDFLAISGKGNLPEKYYIASHDHSYNDEDLIEIHQTKIICNLINSLSAIADYHDEKNDSSTYNLIFTQNEGDTKSKTTSLKTIISKNSLTTINPALAIALSTGNESTDNHHQAKIYTFKSSIVEFCEKTSTDDRFGHLLKDWDLFLKIYNNNLSTYLSGFSFHKAKKDVATAQMLIAEQLSKITGETTGRLLTIPISFAAVIAILKLDSLKEAFIICLGLTILSIITNLSIANQKKQLSRLISSRNITFNSFQGKANLYPEELNLEISQAISALEKNETFLSGTLRCYELLCWLPTIFSIIVTLNIFGPDAKTYKVLFLYTAKLFSNSVINN